MKIKFNEGIMQWEQLPNDSKDGIYFSPLLYQKLMNIQRIRKKGWDCIFLIDGPRRGGKSTLGLTCAKILKPNLTINNVARGTEDAAKKIEALPDDDVLLIDEGSLVFNSKEAMKRENVWLSKIIDVCGMKRLVLIVILPSFFDLLKSIATLHSRFLIHVYTDKELTRGRFAYFGDKKKRRLYEFGKKNYGSYAFPQADFIDRFVDYNPLGEEYYALKRRVLLEALKEPEKKDKSIREKKFMLQRNSLIHYLVKEKGLSSQALNRVMVEYGVPFDNTNISKIVLNISDKLNYGTQLKNEKI